ncbi:MAG: adenylate/guanylate cyclase domain-containing protein [Saprospiraceae bacterium]|nr:adenylate/guanylate cyclase domain-containing protein [Saprospiraceae bacterium]
MIRLTPKTKRNISRIIPFGVIWVLCGWVTIISEIGLTRNVNPNPDTDISFTIPVLIFANIANLMVGLLVGALEVIYLEKRFAFHTLRAKIFYKFIIYLILFLFIIVVLYPVAFSLDTGAGMLADETWDQLRRFLNSASFATTLFQLSVPLFVCLIYAAVSENLGHHVFLNFFTGKYHQPVVEERIFMFLDMKSSTTIAESLGHVKYFKLLREYYDLMSDPIIDSLGEVYQYIGDEIVVSWDLDRGLQNANCIRCFFDIRDSLNAKHKELLSKYGHEIDFKAGLHFGEVTIGEIGALKKEIAFTGDVLNTTARIQSLCNQYESSLLISGKLKEILPQGKYTFENKGEIALKGRVKKEELYSIAK